MLGVVLWTDQTEGKAVIWCEDQGKLAYLTGDQAALCADMNLQAGDMVSFSLRMDKRLRFAENLSLIEENSHVGLADALRPEQQAAPAQGTTEPLMDQGAEIIPFRAKAPQPRSEQSRVARAGA
jgi:cold shock CspA family protein